MGRMKTEFLVQFDGVQSGQNEGDRVLLVGATNLPWELDDAALRRFPKRILVDRPDSGQRGHLLNRLLSEGKGINVSMKQKEMEQIVTATEGYSGSDLKNLVNDAAMGPIRMFGNGISV